MTPRRAMAVVPVKARTSSSSPAPRIDVMVSSSRVSLFLIVLRDPRSIYLGGAVFLIAPHS